MIPSCISNYFFGNPLEPLYKEVQKKLNPLLQPHSLNSLVHNEFAKLKIPNEKIIQLETGGGKYSKLARTADAIRALYEKTYLLPKNQSTHDSLVKIGYNSKLITASPDFLLFTQVNNIDSWMRLQDFKPKSDTEISFWFKKGKLREVVKWDDALKEMNISIGSPKLESHRFMQGEMIEKNGKFYPVMKVKNNANTTTLRIIVTLEPIKRFIDFKGGHSTMEVCVPNNTYYTNVTSMALYPKDYQKVLEALLQTHPGDAQNPDGVMTRIEMGKLLAYVKELIIPDDTNDNFSLYTLLLNFEKIVSAHLNKICDDYKKDHSNFTKDELNKLRSDFLKKHKLYKINSNTLLEAFENKSRLRILFIIQELERLQKLMKEGVIELPTNLKTLNAQQKAGKYLKFCEHSMKNPHYHAVHFNCSYFVSRGEEYAKTFLGAYLNEGKTINNVYGEKEKPWKDLKPSLFDRISNIVARSFIFIISSLPLTGWYLGRGTSAPGVDVQEASLLRNFKALFGYGEFWDYLPQSVVIRDNK